MAFVFAKTKKTLLPGGYVLEEGTFDLDSVTTGNITVDTTEQPEIVKIERFGVDSDGDNTVATARDVNPTTLKITGTSNDTGKYWLIGKAA